MTAPFKYPLLNRLFDLLKEIEPGLLNADPSVAVIFCIVQDLPELDEDKANCVTGLVGGADSVHLAIEALTEHAANPEQQPSSTQVN